MPVKFSISKTPSGWQVDLRKSGGGRKFFRTREAAQAFADSKSSEVKDYGETALKLTHEKRIEFLRAIDRLAEYKATLKDALDFYEKHHQVIQSKPIEDIADEFSEAKRQSGKRHRYVLMLESAVRTMRTGTNAKLLHEITPTVIEKWFKAKGYAPSSRRSLMIHLSTFFDFAIKRGYAQDNPIKRLERISMDEKPVGILTVAQCKHLMETCQRVDPVLVDFIAVQLFGGLRPVEAQAVLPHDFSDDHINVTSTGSKTRTRRLVTINVTLRAWLHNPPLFPAVNWRRRLCAVKAAAGMTETWPSDCLRHTSASMMFVISGAVETSIQHGHSERVLLQHYRAVFTLKEAEAFYALRPTKDTNPGSPAKTGDRH